MGIRKPRLIFTIIAWVAMFVGIVSLLGVLNTSTAKEALGGTLVSLAFLVPSGWWFHCQSVDTKKQREYERAVQTNESLAPFLDERDDVVRQGMGMLTPPTRKDRHWAAVSLLSAVLLVAGGMLVPSGDEREQEKQIESR